MKKSTRVRKSITDEKSSPCSWPRGSISMSCFEKKARKANDTISRVGCLPLCHQAYRVIANRTREKIPVVNSNTYSIDPSWLNAPI